MSLEDGWVQHADFFWKERRVKDIGTRESCWRNLYADRSDMEMSTKQRSMMVVKGVWRGVNGTRDQYAKDGYIYITTQNEPRQQSNYQANGKGWQHGRAVLCCLGLSCQVAEFGMMMGGWCWQCWWGVVWWGKVTQVSPIRHPNKVTWNDVRHHSKGFWLSWCHSN